MSAREIVVAAVVTLLCLVVSIWFADFLGGMWRSFRAKRHEGMDEEYESRLCAQCGYDMRASGDRCPECGTLQADRRRYLRALAEGWPDTAVNPIPPHIGDPMVILLSTMNEWEAGQIEGQLRSRGVWATGAELQQKELLGAVARTIYYYRVLVPESEKERAAAILNRFRRAGAAEDGT